VHTSMNQKQKRTPSRPANGTKNRKGFSSRCLCVSASLRECFFIIFTVMCFLPAVGLAQTQPNKPKPAATPDTTMVAKNAKPGSPANTTKPDTAKASEEMELESISIEAIIEKPNVDIIPKRLEPELEEVEFVERSFERELKEAPKDMLLLDDDLDRVAKLEGIKKMLEKKKKKQDK